MGNAATYKEVYKETYRKHTLRIRRDLNPTLPSATGYVVDEAFVQAAGRLADGREFQDVRVYLRPAIQEHT